MADAELRQIGGIYTIHRILRGWSKSVGGMGMSFSKLANPQICIQSSDILDKLNFNFSLEINIIATFTDTSTNTINAKNTSTHHSQ
jgi:hypothetical protein